MTISRYNMRNNITHRSRMPSVLQRSRSGSPPRAFHSARSNTSSVRNIQSVPVIAAKYRTLSPNYNASASRISSGYQTNENSSSVSNYPFDDGTLSTGSLTRDSTLSRHFLPGGRSRSSETLSSESLSRDARDSPRNILPRENSRSKITDSFERSARSNSLPRYSAYGSLTGSRFDERRGTAEPFSTNFSTERSNVASVRPNRWSTNSASSRVRSPSPITYQTLRTKREFESLPTISKPPYRNETSSANLLSRGPARESTKIVTSRTRSMSPVNRRRTRTRMSFEPHISNTLPSYRNESFIVDGNTFPRQSHWIEGSRVSLPSRICHYKPCNPVSLPSTMHVSKDSSSSRSRIPSRTSSHERFGGVIEDESYPLSSSRRSDNADGQPSSFRDEVQTVRKSPVRTYGSPEIHNTYQNNDEDKFNSSLNFKLPNNEPFQAIQHSIDNIHVTDIDCHVSENARAHHNERFASLQEPMLIVRRGQSFRITLLLNKRFSNPKHTLALSFTTGQKPQPGKLTYVELHYPCAKPPTENWKIKLDSEFGDRLTFAIEPSADCVIGEWKLSASIIDEDGKRSVNKTAPLVILFNPWCQDDTVYFPDSTKLAEYILNDSSCIFTGTQDQIVARPWFYGQFEPGVLEASLYCLSKSFNIQHDKASGDPFRVARAICNIINSKNDKECLHTDRDLSGNYATSPLSWIGSASILRKFLETKAPVQYGHCFVFAGVLTTICRALGIPCRPVTSFNSAVGTDGTTDVHWDTTNNTEIEGLNTDSVWTFHVWNEVYMKRRDLPAGYDGWQAIQAVPRETGAVCYGPAPLSAILSGKSDVIYDVGNIYDQLNSDRIHWGRGKDGCWNVISIEKAIFGKRLSTKTPDGQAIPTNFTDCSPFREDITNQYKLAEANTMERVSLLSPPPRVSQKRHIYTTSNDIECKLLTPKEIQVGEDFDLVIVLTNASGVVKPISGRLLCNVTTYSGEVLQKIKNETFSKVVEPYEQEEILIHMAADDYVGNVGQAEYFRAALFCKSEDCKTQFAKLENFKLNLPRLILKVRDKFVHVKSPVQLTMTFTNPLKSKSLTNCRIFLEGNGINEPRGHFTRNVVAGETFQQTLTVTPTSKGCCTIFVTFCCDQLSDINGNIDIFVQ